jgi:hypothetical protein
MLNIGCTLVKWKNYTITLFSLPNLCITGFIWKCFKKEIIYWRAKYVCMNKYVYILSRIHICLDIVFICWQPTSLKIEITTVLLSPSLCSYSVMVSVHGHGIILVTFSHISIWTTWLWQFGQMAVAKI